MHDTAKDTRPGRTASIVAFTISLTGFLLMPLVAPIGLIAALFYRSEVKGRDYAGWNTAGIIFGILGSIVAIGMLGGMRP